MKVSPLEYKRILNAKLVGQLTVFIDTSAFRRLFVNKINPRQLSMTIGRSVESSIQTIRNLTYLDALAPVIASILSVIAFGWFGIFGIAFAFVVWSFWKQYACRGVQSFIDAGIALIVCATAALLLPLPNWWARFFFLSLGMIFLSGRLLYWVTAKTVFDLIDSSHEFFNMFYLEPQNAIVPLIWTSEWNEQQRINHDKARTDILAEL